ncbi:LacI family transcriptional regulator [Motilibacter rhizosphaerae]|uniref:LacI family transcriptional regulator n=1 Tax=Motilibacter rhizosphaerae TaxID=598652 RepID=A0A4Q7NRT3_9ACTN|nr:LacI family DNA-binding transcriptional regulator [Motilibacter rhizosphaerae]RZS89796.1 LacI family transcriptional regulator [Motilibacter rhizosphaerae]
MVEAGRRPTIRDIAREVGISKASVSFALNGRPGVSAETRAAVLDAAKRLGWHPSSAARGLSEARARAVGLVVARPPELLQAEPFFAALIAGLESALSPLGIGLTLTLVGDVREESEVHRRWWAERRVDGVVVIDVRARDPRLPVLREIGLPAVVFGSHAKVDGIPSLRVDDRAPATAALTHLVERGHRRIARVGGPAGLASTRSRASAFRRASEQLTGQTGTDVSADYTPEGGVRAVRELLALPEPPSAVLFDNDVMAVAAISACLRDGLRVPDDLAVVAWDDSLMCRLTCPGVSALGRDVVGDAGRAARMLVRATEGEDVADEPMSERVLVVRESS